MSPDPTVSTTVTGCQVGGRQSRTLGHRERAIRPFDLLWNDEPTAPIEAN